MEPPPCAQVGASPSGTQDLYLAKLKLQTGSDTSDGLLRVMMSTNTPFYTLWFSDPWIPSAGDITPSNGHWFKMYAQPKGCCHSLAGYHLSIETLATPLRGCSDPYPGQQLQDGAVYKRNHGSSKEQGPIWRSSSWPKVENSWKQNKQRLNWI